MAEKATIIVADSWRDVLQWCKDKGVNFRTVIYASQKDKIRGLDHTNVKRIVILDKKHPILETEHFQMLKQLVDMAKNSM